MLKRDLIKKLHELGVRKAEKPGVGYVCLEQMKARDLVGLLVKAEVEKEDRND